MRKRLSAMVVATLLLQLALLPACAHGPSERGASQSATPAADGVGTRGHPTAISQQKSADRLVAVIRESLGTAGERA
ncbi:MAG: hypothetical protein J6D54_01850 [Olsenella sp.]|nr:hypothetical protein [Olsenella sp.]